MPDKKKIELTVSDDDKKKKKYVKHEIIKEKKSIFDNKEGSIIKIPLGILFTIFAFIILVINEIDSINKYKILDQGAGEVVQIDPDLVNSSNEGKLVHVTGLVESDKMISDRLLKISVEAIRLKRIVEMYQWNEKQIKKDDKNTNNVKTCSYSKVWSKKLNNSDFFKEKQGHVNPKTIILDNKDFIPKEIKIGEFQLSKSLVNMIRGYKKIPIDDPSIVFLK